VHSPVNGDTNEYLIFGNLPITPAAASLPAELAAFLGRWEGYSYGPPVKRDLKIVLFVQEITAQGGKAFVWGDTNLQYPTKVKEVQFRIVQGTNPSIEWEYMDIGVKNVIKLTYERDEDILRGWVSNPMLNEPWGPFKLNQDRSFYIYKDYARYLAGKRIYSKTFRDSELKQYGKGYLIYLPEEYESQPEKTWPLIFFLHGSGDRGDNLFLLAKASPFMLIREKGPLPFIIVAPLLQEEATFPEAYMDGMLNEALTAYRVDRKRVYVTGLSMGGEATYRFALHRPETFAAIAPLAAFNPKYAPSTLRQGYKAFEVPMERIKDLPVWAIHGENDIVVPLNVAQSTVDDLEKAGGNVRFTILKDHDHDVWTDTYSNPKFYDWLLQHQRQ
jgi:predicted esterase